MFGLGMLDVLIGVILVFLLLSTVCSALVELLAALFCWRSGNLAAAVGSLLHDHDDHVQAFFNHPRIWALCPDPRKWNWLRRQAALLLLQRNFYKDGDKRPSYLDAQTFTDVLVDLIVPENLPSAHRQSFWAVRDVVLTNPAPGAPSATSGDGGIDLAKNSDLRRALRSFVESALATASDHDPDADIKRLTVLKNALAAWFDQTMDRATGWYKRHTQAWILVFAVIVVGGLNIDTLSIMQALNQSPALRQQAVALAQEMTKPATTQPTTQPDGRTTALQHAQATEARLQQLANAGLPVGWDQQIWSNTQPGWREWLEIICRKLLGLLITVFAVSLGAPFWFDTLNKLVNLRGTGGQIAAASRTDNTNPGSSDQSQAVRPPASPSPGIIETSGSASVTLLPGPGVPLKITAETSLAVPNDYWSQDQRKEDWARFDPLATAYHPANAVALAKAALLAYQSGAVIARITTTRWGFTHCAFCDDHDTEAFVASNDRMVLIAFRGTEPSHLQDILADARIALAPPEITIPSGVGGAGRTLHIGTGQVHEGFLKALGYVLKSIDDEVHQCLAALPGKAGASAPAKTLWLTGHSLGAALATLYAARIVATHGAERLDQVNNVQGLYTFGSPRVGNKAFVDNLSTQLATRIFRTVDDRDIVTRVPPRIFGYDHLGQVLYLDANGHLDTTSTGWVRFLNTMIDAAGDFKQLAETSVKDHSMDLYVRKLQNLLG